MDIYNCSAKGTCVVANMATFEYSYCHSSLFGGCLRIELHNSSLRTNRTIMLKSSCIRRMVCFPPNRSTLVFVVLQNSETEKIQYFGYVIFELLFPLISIFPLVL